MIDFINTIGTSWGSIFISALIQNTIFLAIILFVLFRFSRLPARLSYIVAIIGLIKLLLPPFIPSHLWESTAVPLSFMNDIPATLIRTSGTSALPTTASEISLAGMLFLIWMIIAILYLAFSLITSFCFALRIRRATPIDNDHIIESTIPDTITVHKTGRIPMPLTIGWYPKRIFVPEAWSSWSGECRRAVLRHELAHLQRFDAIVQTLQIVSQALYFFHPLVWLLNHRIQQYREMACDDSSIQGQSSSRATYSRYLVEIAESILHQPVRCDSASALIKRQNELLQRVQYQLRGGIMYTRNKVRFSVLLAGLILLMVPLSWYHSSESRAAGGDQTLPRTKTEYPSITLAVQADDKILIDDKQTAYTEVVKELKKLVGKNDERTVIKLVCGDEVSMGVVHAIQKQLIDAGLTAVEFRDQSGHHMPLELPSKKISQRMKEIPEEHIVDIHITAEGVILWNKQKTDKETLSQQVRRTLDTNAHTIVSLSASEDTIYRDFLSTLRQVKAGGSQRIFVKIPGN